MRKCRIDQKVLKKRRAELAKAISGGAILLPAHPELIRNRDVHYPYRQDSSLYYFTGFEEPETVMLFCPGAEHEYVLFVRKKDAERETWDGFRFGPQGAEQEFGVDKAYLIDDIETLLPNLLDGVEKIYYRLGSHQDFDKVMEKVLSKIQSQKGRGASALPAIYDPSDIIGDMRLIKREDEVVTLRTACEVTARAHIAAMKFVRPGVNERQVQGVLSYMMYMDGAAREGYTAIVASGNSATTLHYNFNDQVCQDGDLLLIDAGAEFEYYTGDITRTFPVNGKFTESQRVFYQAVLDVQKKIIDMCRPGTPFNKLQETTIQLLVEAMIELKLLDGEPQEIIKSNRFKKYYPHGVSHWLGMDVHDVGTIVAEGSPRKLKEGMCFTVEPGLYVPADDMEAPEEFRGLGVRIEDDILITSNGHEVMTAAVPKEVDEIEKIIGEAKSVMA